MIAIRVLGGLLMAATLCTHAAPVKVVTVGVLEWSDDARYQARHLKAHYRLQPWGRPWDGARVAVKESRFPLAAEGMQLKLERVTAKDQRELEQAVTRLSGEGVGFFLADLPAAPLAELAKATAGRPLMLFNVSALDDVLRGTGCSANLYHLAPSRAMLSDALAQYLVQHKWRSVLALEGPRPDDQAMAEAFRRSAKRFGLRIEATRTFQLGHDPRQRQHNNIALLTTGETYDVVFVADADGEFARGLPYQTQLPRPVVGGAGLVADWWHWAWERHGAPQLNDRFTRLTGRPMTGYDWAAWMGVKAIAEALLRVKQTEFAPLADYIAGKTIVLDGFKGYRLSFRPWNHQLRQPLFLTTDNWVIARAPLEGFLHARQNLDTLGMDKRESECRFE